MRILEGVARVATSVVPAGGPPSMYFEISFWKQTKTGWSLVSFEPWPASPRFCRSNVQRSCDMNGPADLSEVERLQWLDLRLDLLDLTSQTRAEAGRGGALIGHGFGSAEFDVSYLPLLKKRLSQGSIASRAAVAVRLAELGGAVPFDTLAELVAQVASDEARGALVELVASQVAPRFKKARAATSAELTAIAGPQLKQERTGLIVDDLAKVSERDFSRGSETLYRKTAQGWVEVCGLSSWVF